MFRVFTLLFLFLSLGIAAGSELFCQMSERTVYSTEWFSNFISAKEPSGQSETGLSALKVTESKPKIILIIDDMGDNFRLGRRVIELPAAMNLSILPHTPFAKKLAKLGHKRGHDVMLHFPMEATTRPDLLGKGSLRVNHTRAEATAIFEQNLQEIPFVKGFNNHMGSRLTKSRPHMEWLMDLALEKQLYFVDSRTISDSLAQQLAEQVGVATLGRDIFLDPVIGDLSVEQQLQRALKIADERGQVVVIGHPFAETVEVLEHLLPRLMQAYSFVTVSDYFAEQRTMLVASTAKQNGELL